MKKYLLLGVMAAAFTASPALAQDSEGAPFSGPRIEGRIGFDLNNFDVTYDDGVDQFAGDDEMQGITLGGELGYDFQAGSNFVVGAYIGADHSSAGVCSEVFGQDQACINSGLNLTAGVRVGASVANGGALVYGKAGFSLAQPEVTYDDFEDILEDFEMGDDLEGWHLGGGVEMGLSGSSYLRLDYTFTNYGGFSLDDGDVATTLDFTRHQVMFGVGFRI
jgi:outer membrane immunogenic protein